MTDYNRNVNINFTGTTAGLAQASLEAQKKIDQIKASIREVAEESKRISGDISASFSAISKAMSDAMYKSLNIGGLKEALKEARAELANIRAMDVPREEKQVAVDAQVREIERIKDALDRANAAWKEYQANASNALRQLQAEASANTNQFIEGVDRQASRQLEAVSATSAVQRREEALQREALAQQTRNMQEYVRITRQGYGEMSQGAQEYGQRIAEIKAQLQQMVTTQGMSLQQAGAQLRQQMGGTATAVRDINVALGEMQPKIAGADAAVRTMVSNFQKMSHMLFNILGLLALVRGLIMTFKELADSGNEFSRALFNMEVGVRALRRTGMDITFQEVLDNLNKLRSSYGVFTSKELIEGSASFATLVRDMGLTKEQFFNLQTAVAQLAVVNGRSMAEVQKTLALTLSSGYTEGLQRLGVSMNRVTVAAKAAELGWKGGYLALTEYQRGQATYAEFMEKMAKFEDDLARYYETYPGRLAKAEASVKNYADAIGLRVAPALILWNEMLEFVMYALFQASKPIALFIRSQIYMKENFIALYESAADFFTMITNPQSWGQASDNAVSFSEKLANSQKTFYEDMWKILSDEQAFTWAGQELGSDNPLGSRIEREADDAEDALNKVVKRFYDARQSYLERMGALERDFNDDVARLDRQLERDIVEAQRKRDEKLEENRKDKNNREMKILRDYQQAVEDAEYTHNKKLSDLSIRYNEQQLREEIRYQEKLRGLREDYQLEMEDALRERDALAVIRIVRKYNREKAQADRQHEQSRAEQRRQYAIDLADAEEQRRRKLEVLKREYEDKIKDLADALEKQRKKEMDAFEEKEAELRRKNAVARDERRIRWEEQQREEGIRWDERLKRLADEFALEGKLTDEYVEDIYMTLAEMFGPGGRTEQLFQYMIVARRQYMKEWASIGATKPSTSSTYSYPNFYGPSNTPSPSSTYSYPNAYGPPPSPSSTGGGSSVNIEVSLDPSLEMRIIEEASDSVANVLVTQQRRTQ